VCFNVDDTDVKSWPQWYGNNDETQYGISSARLRLCEVTMS